jgi:hypothetical protein
MGREPVGGDILTTIPGIEFDASWKRRVEGVIDFKTGLRAFFISREDLIDTKLASGRPQDLADVNAIQQAVQSLEPTRAKRSSPIRNRAAPSDKLPPPCAVKTATSLN